jgi:hypothetical protein
MSLRKTLSALAATLFIGLSGLAQAGPDTETDGNDVILAGHDAVAYFTENKKEDVPKHIAEADSAWPGVKDIPADKL